MSILNQTLRLFFDAILWPFHSLPPIVAIAVVSVVAGVGMLWVFKVTSDQDALAAVKSRIHAGLFEIRLFNDDIRAIFRAQGSILRHNLTYLRLSAKPLIWILPPFVLILAQLQFLYGYTGLEIGKDTLVRVEVSAAAAEGADKPAVVLEVPAGLELRSPSVWAPDLREMAWLIAADEPGTYDLQIRMGEDRWTKRLVVGDQFARRAPERLSGTFVHQLLYPAEAPLPKSGPIQAIRVAYANAEVSFLGFDWHWMIWFLVLSIVAAFALRNRMGVTI